MADERKVSYKEASDLANEYGIKYFEVSAKANQGVQELYFSLVTDVYYKRLGIEERKTIKINR